MLSQLLLGWFYVPSARKHKILSRTSLYLLSSKAEVCSFTYMSNRDRLKDRRGLWIHQGYSIEETNVVSPPRRLRLMFSPC